MYFSHLWLSVFQFYKYWNVHQTGQGFRFLSIKCYRTCLFILRVEILSIPLKVVEYKESSLEIDTFSTHFVSRYRIIVRREFWNSNSEFRNELFRSFFNFHHRWTIIPCGHRSVSRYQPQFFSFPCACMHIRRTNRRGNNARRFGRLLRPNGGEERKKSWRNRQGLKGMPIRRGAALLCPRGTILGRGQRHSMERAMKVAFARLRAAFHLGLLFMGIRGWFLPFGGSFGQMTIMICGSARV